VNDATFIIFHCGDRERIGIRHRESQTLYLSGLIDTTACKDPTYGEIQVGLYLAIIQDALQRQKQRSSQSPSSSSKKRPAEGSQTSRPKPKRQKVEDLEDTNARESGLSDIGQVNFTSNEAFCDI
jgi:ADP-heptose:LPS heptosyltransferase